MPTTRELLLKCDFARALPSKVEKLLAKPPQKKPDGQRSS